MSTDYIAICDECRLKIYFGKSNVAGDIVGYGSNHIEEQNIIMNFVFKHVFCNLYTGTRISLFDKPNFENIEEGYIEDDYTLIEIE